jgi:hypothetical protein
MSTGGSSLLVLGAGELTGTTGPGSSGDTMDNCGTNSDFIGSVTFGGAMSSALAGVIGFGAIAFGVVARGGSVFGDSTSGVEVVLFRDDSGAGTFGAGGSTIGFLELLVDGRFEAGAPTVTRSLIGSSRDIFLVGESATFAGPVSVSGRVEAASDIC